MKAGAELRAPLRCRVGRVEDGDLRRARAEPALHLVEGGGERALARRPARGVAVVEEAGVLDLLLALLRAAELSHVEVPRLVPEPVQITEELVAQKGLAPAGEAHKDDDELLAVDAGPGAAAAVVGGGQRVLEGRRRRRRRLRSRVRRRRERRRRRRRRRHNGSRRGVRCCCGSSSCESSSRGMQPRRRAASSHALRGPQAGAAHAALRGGKRACGAAAVLGHLAVVLRKGVVVVGGRKDDVLEVDVRGVFGGLVDAAGGVGGGGRGAAG